MSSPYNNRRFLCHISTIIMVLVSVPESAVSDPAGQSGFNTARPLVFRLYARAFLVGFWNEVGAVVLRVRRKWE